MKIYGLDFTSSPSANKPITCVAGNYIRNRELTIYGIETFPAFAEFEQLLQTKGPWFAGMDFPFGLPLRFIESLGVKPEWSEYVSAIGVLQRKQFEEKIRDYQNKQPKGNKEPLRIGDALANAQSPLKLVQAPTGKMFFEGATRLCKSGVCVLPCRPNSDSRMVIETYPPLLARRLTDSSYKSDKVSNVPPSQITARQEIIENLLSGNLAGELGFQIHLSDSIKTSAMEDISGDTLDAVFCAVNAAWSYSQEKPHYGIPGSQHPTIRSEGWIVDVALGRSPRIGKSLAKTKDLQKSRSASKFIDEFKTLRREIKRLSEIGRALSGERDINYLLEMIIDEARNITNADGGTLYIQENNALSFKIVQNDSLKIRMGGTSGIAISFPPVELKQSNVSAYAALTGNLVNITDVYKHAPFDFTGPKNFDAKTGYRTKSMLVVPMKNHQNKVVGVLQLINARSSENKDKIISFSKNRVSLIESLASQAAIAITNVFLIGEEQRMKAILQETEARTRSIMDFAPDGIIVVDEQGVIETFNATAEKIFGYPATEVIGKDIGLLIPQSARAETDSSVNGYFSIGNSKHIGSEADIYGIRKDRSKFPIGIEVSEVRFGKTRLYSGIVRDISERKKAEKELLRLGRAIESTAEAVVVTSTHGIIQSINPAFTAITGFSADEVLGKTNNILKSGEQPGEFYEILWNAISGGNVWKGHIVNKRKDRSLYDAFLTISPIFNERGVCEGYVGVHRDVTAERKAQKEIIETNTQLAIARDEALEASQAKSRFLANMSHELRTPMNAIIGYSEMLLEEAHELQMLEMVSDLEKINTAGKQLLNLISDILDLSKIEAGKMEINLQSFDIVNLVQEVEHIIMPMAMKNQNTLTIVCDSSTGSMVADLNRTRQMLLNLLSNACKFTEKGEIKLNVQRESDQDADWVYFAIKDTGIGMNRDQLGSVFNEFTQVHPANQTKYGGTGLGLAISRRFCRMMGGDITVESVVDRGSVFTICLPVKVMPLRLHPRRRVSDASST